MRNKIQHTQAQRWQRILIVAILDSLCIATAFLAGLLIRYEFSFSAIPVELKEFYCMIVPPWIAVSLLVFSLFVLRQ